ncbi:CsbD family protein [Arthrobacter crystallopoietes]|uniref:CsbD family protein n=1 Tax=Crystallibacter crystallopoietes TaxID=37928 RepID=UPI0011114F78|nr:CsbD family protein [Arthrobacter crystallopoietes]
MGLGDRIENKAQEASGKIKEKAGDATDNPDLQAGGQLDQAEAKIKDVGEDVKDRLDGDSKR